jgi:threonine dehydrogenase-like Zn-dependent dehydrogenase
MRALYWDGHELRLDLSYPTPQQSKIEDRESKILGSTGSRVGFSHDQTALVKVHLAGICFTDLQIFKGYMGFQGVPGHEFIGAVVEGPQELVNKRVVGEINFGCGPFAPALEALAERSVSVTPLIEKLYSLDEGVATVVHAGRPGARKILLQP